MNDAHLHLIVNHVSMFSLVIGTIVFAVSMKRKSTELRLVATGLFLIAGLFGWFSVDTGRDAVKTVVEMNEDSKPFIHHHAQAAAWAQRSGFLVAALAIALEWANRKKKKWVKPLQWILLIFAIHGCTVFARTVYLGGQIRHTEIRRT